MADLRAIRDDAGNAFPSRAPPSAVQSCDSQLVPKPGDDKPKTPKNCPAETILANATACGGPDIWAKAKAAWGQDPTLVVGPTSTGFAAETDHTAHQIRIKPTTNCCDATESLVFELHNAAGHPDLIALTNDALAGDVSRADYIYRGEKLEFNNALQTAQIFKKCKKSWGCADDAQSSLQFAADAKDYDAYFKTLDNGHKEVYGTWWDSNCKTAYDKKHPPKGGK